MASLGAARDVVALDIGSSSLKAAQLKRGRGGYSVGRTAMRPLPEGLVADGQVIDADGVASEIKRMWREERLPRGRVRLGVANSQVSVRTLEVPRMDNADELRAAVEFEAGEVMPIPLHEAILDFQPLPSLEGGMQEQQRVVVVAAQREMIERLVGTLHHAGLRPAGVDLEAFALLRALLPPAEPDAEGGAQAQVVCHVGSSHTNVVVSVNRQCEFVRLVPFAGSQLTAAVARGIDVSLDEAEALKVACGLLGDIPDGWSADKVRDVRRALAFGARPLVDEVRRSLDFYRSQPTARPIERIVLAGGTSLCAGLDRYLQQALSIPVLVGDPLSNIAHGGGVGPDLAAYAAVALGLALTEEAPK
jgi:type IV pilus assembly protein PilM